MKKDYDMELNAIFERWLYPIDMNEIVSLVPLSKMLELKERVLIGTVLKRYYEDLRKLLIYIEDIGVIIPD